MEYRHRQQRLRAIHGLADGASWFITDPVAIRYLTGFHGDSGVMVMNEDRVVLYTDSRYTAQAKQQATVSQVVEARGEPLWEAAGSVLAAQKANPLYVTEEAMSYGTFLRFQQAFPQFTLIAAETDVDRLRWHKEKQEISYIRQAAAITDRLFAEVSELLVPGATERQVANELEAKAKRYGADGMSFDPIVASGPNGALPHAEPGKRALRKGDTIVVDLGVTVQGYCSDATRTFCIGKPLAEVKAAYATCYQALQIGLAAMRPGATGDVVDAAVRGVIAAAGHAKHFGHATGHGVGLAVHEGVRISPNSPDTLEPGMIVTCEPGIYLPKLGGVRLEELVLITDTGCEILSRAAMPSDLAA